jgi:hypothetical protein
MVEKNFPARPRAGEGSESMADNNPSVLISDKINPKEETVIIGLSKAELVTTFGFMFEEGGIMNDFFSTSGIRSRARDQVEFAWFYADFADDSWQVAYA